MRLRLTRIVYKSYVPLWFALSYELKSFLFHSTLLSQSVDWRNTVYIGYVHRTQHTCARTHAHTDSMGTAIFEVTGGNKFDENHHIILSEMGKERTSIKRMSNISLRFFFVCMPLCQNRLRTMNRLFFILVHYIRDNVCHFVFMSVYSTYVCLAIRFFPISYRIGPIKSHR